MMKNNVRLKKRILFLLFVLVLALGMSSCNKAPLMTDEKLTQLYDRVNETKIAEVTNKDLSNRIAIIDGVEYELEYRQTFVYDEDVYDSKRLSAVHSFVGGNNNDVYVQFADDKNDPNDWLIFTMRNEKTGEQALSVEERAEIALEYASKHINTEGYVLQKGSIQTIINGSSNYEFVFTKMINGFESSDKFIVSINKTGYICGFSRQSYGMFNDIKVPKIDETLLLEKVNEYAKKIHGEVLSLEIIEDRTEITLDKDGIPMIKVDTNIIRAATEEEKKLNNKDVRYVYSSLIPVYCEDVKSQK